MSTHGKTYQDAITALNTLQSNAAALASYRAAPSPPEVVVEGQLYYLRRLALTPASLNSLNVIHITGTKGKGSTSAFVSSLLCTLAPSAKVGLFTSPHLVAVRERIRINGVPVSEDLFAKYFWQVWDALGAEDNVAAPLNDAFPLRPQYFKFLGLVAYQLFLGEKVDATVLEVGIGGTMDVTNLVPSPIATGITVLGLDHVEILGHTIAEIGGQKGGIYKPGVPALTIAEQPAPGIHVLASKAAELKASSFSPVPLHPDLISEQPVSLGLKGKHQISNASVAIALVSAFLASPRKPSLFPHLSSIPRDDTAATTVNVNLPPIPARITPQEFDITSFQPPPSLPSDIITPQPLPDIFRTGLEKARWAGRCQIVVDPLTNSSTSEDDFASAQLNWGIDGAHTVESLECCGEWFRDTFVDQQPRDAMEKRKRVLVFNCTGGRNSQQMLTALLVSTSPVDSPLRAINKRFFDEAIFCTNVTHSDTGFKAEFIAHSADMKELKALSVQLDLAQAWRNLLHLEPDDPTVHVLYTIEDAVKKVRALSQEAPVDVLVTGSLHLVGGLIHAAGLEHVL